jgi:hypothetical protein
MFARRLVVWGPGRGRGTEWRRSGRRLSWLPLGTASSGLGRFAVGLADFDVALGMEVLDAVPASVDVDVGDDLATINPGDEFDRLIAVDAGGCAARFDGPHDGPAFPDGRGIAHVMIFGPFQARLYQMFFQLGVYFGSRNR